MTAAERTRRWKADQYAQRTLTDHLCECGCGQRTYTAIVTDSKRGHVGEPLRFLSRHGSRADRMTADERREAKRRRDAADHQRHHAERLAKKRAYESTPEAADRRRGERAQWTAGRRAREQARKNAWARRTGRSRRAARENATLEDAEFTFVLMADPCAYCGAPSQHVDHIVPKRNGGLDAAENWTGACASCNTSKRATPLLLFLLRR